MKHQAILYLVSVLSGSSLLGEQVYFNDFESAAGTEWSRRTRDLTPVGARRFLGQFGNQTVRLTLNDLPNHNQVGISFDLFIIRTWDGYATGHPEWGPEKWQLDITDGPVLINTNFSTSDGRFGILVFNQAYPGAFGQGNYPPHTGASEINSLGYTFYIGEPVNRLMEFSSVYHLSFAFPHTGNQIQFNFTGSGLQGLNDESWGLDNVSVTCDIKNQRPEITHIPVQSALQNREIEINFVVEDPDGNLATIELYYRRSGLSDWRSEIQSDSLNGQKTLIIPAEFVTMADVDYYIKATDTKGLAGFSGTDLIPHHIEVLAENQLKIFDRENLVWVDSATNKELFESAYKTVVIVHGWNPTCIDGQHLTDLNEVDYLVEMAKAIINRLVNPANGTSEVNILGWDWLEEAINTDGSCGLGIEQFFRIPYAKVPNQTTKLVNQLQSFLQTAGYGNLPIHFIGHSLGAHIVAQAGKLMVKANQLDSSKHYPNQITCLEPPSSYPLDIVNLENLCVPLTEIRAINQSVFTELYDGTTNFNPKRFHLFVDVPYKEIPDLGHGVYVWYTKTIFPAEDFVIKVFDKSCSGGDELSEKVGFDTSCLLSSADQKRPIVIDLENDESLDYDYCPKAGFQHFSKSRIPLTYYCNCSLPECEELNEIEDDFVNETTPPIIWGDDNSSSYATDYLNLKTTDNGNVTFEFRFNDLSSDWDYWSFDYNFSPTQLKGKGGQNQDDLAIFSVWIMVDDKRVLVVENDSQGKINKVANTGPLDLRSLQGKLVVFQFVLASTSEDISLMINNFRFFQNPGRENLLPVAEVGGDIWLQAGDAGLALVPLSSAGSYDPDGSTLQYQWLIVENEEEIQEISNEPNPEIYLTPGQYLIRLCVFDYYHQSSCDELTVEISPGNSFIRGDCNSDGEIDISDAVKNLLFLFARHSIDCEDACDVNDSGKNTIADVVYVLRFLFAGGQNPPPPYPNSGMDPTPDFLSCSF